MKKTFSFPVIIEKDDSGMFIGSVPALKSCYTQAKTLPELYERLQEVVSLCIEVEKEYSSDEIKQHDFIGAQKMDFAV